MPIRRVTNRRLLVVVLTLTMLFLVGWYVFDVMFASDEPVSDVELMYGAGGATGVTNPTSSVEESFVPKEVVIYPNTTIPNQSDDLSWQTDVVTIAPPAVYTDTSSGYQGGGVTPSTGGAVIQAETAQEPYRPTTEITDDESELNQYVLPTPVVESMYPPAELGLLKDCGDISIPSGVSAEYVEFAAQSDPAVVCLGEEVAATACGSAQADVVYAGTAAGRIIVAERSDGVCSVGTRISATQVTLCSVQALMNGGAGQAKSMTQWQQEFSRNPGELFAQMYFDNVSTLQTTQAQSLYDCKVYEL